MGDAVLGGEGDEQAVGEVVRQGEQVAHVPVGAEAAERLAGVLHEEVCGEEAAEDADVGLKDLHRVGLVEVDVVDDCMGLLFGAVASFRAET